MTDDSEFDDFFYQKYNAMFEPKKDSHGIGVCKKSGKLCFATKTQARKNRRQFEQEHRANFGIYPCVHCGKFHLFSVDDKWSKNKISNLNKRKQ
jgi:hypothetical protein